MLFPKKTKYSKVRKYIPLGITPRWGKIAFGSFGMMSISAGLITARQLEAARKAITRKLKRVGMLYIRVFPNIPVTKKPAEVRMGKGKGSVEYWVAKVDTGKVLFEIDGVPYERAFEAFMLASKKLAIRISVIKEKDGRIFN